MKAQLSNFGKCARKTFNHLTVLCEQLLDGDEAVSRLVVMPLRTRKRLFYNIRELWYSLGHFLVLLSGIARRTRNKQLRDLAANSLADYNTLISNSRTKKLARMRNTVAFAALALEIDRGATQLETLTHFHSLQNSLMCETEAAYNAFLRGNRRSRDLALFRDSLARMACNSLNMATYLIRRGKLNAAFTRFEAVQGLLPLMEPRVAEYFRSAVEFFRGSFKGFHDELSELEEVLREFDLIRGVPLTLDTPNVAFTTSAAAYFQNHVSKRFDARKFALQNQLLVKKLRNELPRQPEDTDEAWTDTVASNVPYRVTIVGKRSTTGVRLRKQENYERLTLGGPRTSVPDWKEPKLSLDPAKLLDQHFRKIISENLGAFPGADGGVGTLEEFEQRAGRDQAELISAGSELRLRGKEQVKIYREYFFDPDTRKMEQLHQVREISQRRRNLSQRVVSMTSTAATTLQKPKTLREFVLAQKLVRASNLEKIKQAYMRIPNFTEVPSYDHSRALRATKEVRLEDHQGQLGGTRETTVGAAACREAPTCPCLRRGWSCHSHGKVASPVPKTTTATTAQTKSTLISSPSFNSCTEAHGKTRQGALKQKAFQRLSLASATSFDRMASAAEGPPVTSWPVTRG